MSAIPSWYQRSLSIVPAKDRKTIQAIAKYVRKHIVEKAGCPPAGACHIAAMKVSDLLLERGIPHEMAGGYWTGPDDNPDPDRPDLGHVWIQFPQWGDIILDVTSDQFSKKAPEIAFPAEPENYEVVDIIPVETVSSARDKAARARATRMFRHPKPGLSIKIKVRVRNHLRHPPKSCLCHKFVSVDRLRRKLIRRLK